VHTKLTTLRVAATMVDQRMTLMRRTEHEQCNFTFPLDDVSEYEANPDIVRIAIRIAVRIH
jgi:hypothetical protein